jgi:hypothetical protein
MPPRKSKRSNAEYQGAVVRPDAPDPSWVPLRLAPYRLQAVPQRLVGVRLQPPRLLGRDEISDFVNNAISSTDIVKCELNQARTGLVVTAKTVGYDSIERQISMRGRSLSNDIARVTHPQSAGHYVSLGRDVESQMLARAIHAHIHHRTFMTGRRTVVFPPRPDSFVSDRRG